MKLKAIKTFNHDKSLICSGDFLETSATASDQLIRLGLCERVEVATSQDGDSNVADADSKKAKLKK